MAPLGDIRLQFTDLVAYLLMVQPHHIEQKPMVCRVMKLWRLMVLQTLKPRISTLNHYASPHLILKGQHLESPFNIGAGRDWTGSRPKPECPAA